jgi:hypothetical protein
MLITSTFSFYLLHTGPLNGLASFSLKVSLMIASFLNVNKNNNDYPVRRKVTK